MVSVHTRHHNMSEPISKRPKVLPADVRRRYCPHCKQFVSVRTFFKPREMFLDDESCSWKPNRDELWSSSSESEDASVDQSDSTKIDLELDVEATSPLPITLQSATRMVLFCLCVRNKHVKVHMW